VEAAQIPPLEMARGELIDPQLKRGDLLLMKGFTWHFADSNRAPSDGRTVSIL
jgi:ectoine hydroxylase-related dioxygenase (phytanoyl-CoA dioxygenase family)